MNDVLIILAAALEDFNRSNTFDFSFLDGMEIDFSFMDR